MKIKHVLASVVCIFLTACGGGDGGVAANVAPAPVVVMPPVVASTIFSEPVDVKCDTANGEKVCDAPTSSKMTKEALAAVLTDAKAGPIVFDIHTTEFRSRSLLQRASPTQPRIATEGNATYGDSRQKLSLSSGAVLFRGKNYAYTGTRAPNATRLYCATTDECMQIGLVADQAGGAQLVSMLVNDSTGSIVNAERIQIESRGAVGLFGLLTDRAAVTVPAGEVIKYSGLLMVQAGDGSPIAPDQFNSGGVRCAVELTLDVRNGRIAPAQVECTDAEKGVLKLSLPALVVEKSRIRTFAMGEVAAIHASKFATTSSSPAPVPLLLGSAAPFNSNAISGAVYGSNADTLIVNGSGSLGMFSILATRQ